MTVFGEWAFAEETKVKKEVIRVSPNPICMVYLQEVETRTQTVDNHMRTQRAGGHEEPRERPQRKSNLPTSSSQLPGL